MGLVIGIDVGGSTTKIVGLNCKGEIQSPLFITAADPVTSLLALSVSMSTTTDLALMTLSKLCSQVPAVLLLTATCMAYQLLKPTNFLQMVLAQVTAWTLKNLSW